MADDTWQEVTITFSSPVTTTFYIGGNFISYFSGELANARCYDSDGNLLEQFYLNEYVDTAADGLNGNFLVGRGGNVGSYQGCSAVIQEESGPPQVLGLNFNRYSALTPTPTLDDRGDILIAEGFTAGLDAYNTALVTTRDDKTFNADGSGVGFVSYDASLDVSTEATWTIKGNFYGTVSSSETLLSKWESGGSNKRSVWIYKASGFAADEIRVGFSSDGLNVNTITLSGVTDENGVLAITYNSGSVSCYWKGSLIDTATITQTSLHQSDAKVGIGCIFYATGQAANIGSFPIANLKIYDSVLTASEIADLDESEPLREVTPIQGGGWEIRENGTARFTTTYTNTYPWEYITRIS